MFLKCLGLSLDYGKNILKIGANIAAPEHELVVY
jgi:hypothetical protein